MAQATSYFWVKTQADGSRKIGLSDSGADDLGKINYVDLPDKGDQLETDGSFVSVEAEKAVSDLPSPVDGEVITVNPKLQDGPDTLNSGDADERWIVIVK